MLAHFRWSVCVFFHQYHAVLIIIDSIFPPECECPETNVRGVEEGKHKDGPRYERRGETTERGGWTVQRPGGHRVVPLLHLWLGWPRYQQIHTGCQALHLKCSDSTWWQVKRILHSRLEENL